MANEKESKRQIVRDVDDALKNFNQQYGKDWNFGTNWSNIGTEWETFINNFLFPKINETLLINVALGNRFNWLAKESSAIGQMTEEYVMLDSIPVSMDLSQSEELMLRRNYPKMATKLYGAGMLKKQKFTLNNNDVRLNFQTLADAVNYAVATLRKKISDINVQEEREVKAMLVDYALTQTKSVRYVASEDDLFNETINAMLNLQNNSEKYNETDKASGGAIARYTTVSALKNLLVLTTDRLKTFLLDTRLANTFNTSGIDLSKKIISFDDLGGAYQTTKDIQITNPDTLNTFKYYGDYQIKLSSTIPAGAVLTFDVTKLPEFAGNISEIKPKTDLFAYIFDINKLRYKRYTKGMLKPVFYNPEFDEVTYWLHYYSFKAMSPFMNNILITGKESDD